MPNKYHHKTVVKYIRRYLNRPIIATSMTDKYDGDFVTLHYSRNEDDSFVDETRVEGFYIFYSVSSDVYARIRAVHFQFKRTSQAFFPIKHKESATCKVKTCHRLETTIKCSHI